MHRFVYVMLAVLTTATCALGQGIAARSTAESLRGLSGVHVIVDEIIPEVRTAGLTAAGVKSAIEDHLMKRGVRVLGLGELTMNPRGPALLVQLDFVAVPPVYFYSSQVQFFQNVTVDVGEGGIPVVASASTWQTNSVGKAGQFRLPTLAQEVVKQVDGFVEAYMTMNEPIVEDPAPESDDSGDSEEESSGMDKTPDMEQ